VKLAKSNPYYASCKPALRHRQILRAIPEGHAMDDPPLQLQEFRVAEGRKGFLEGLVFGAIEGFGRSHPVLLRMGWVRDEGTVSI